MLQYMNRNANIDAEAWILTQVFDMPSSSGQKGRISVISHSNMLTIRSGWNLGSISLPFRGNLNKANIDIAAIVIQTQCRPIWLIDSFIP